MKRLPPHHRPFFAKTILEIGGGHDPYEGVTHAVDKFPDNNSQRAGDLKVSGGVEFRAGDLEEIPFAPSEKFDFLYASHVFEHVSAPDKAISEINRVARRGYLATPSPLREQITCPFPFDPAKDFHTLYCWTTSSRPNTLHVARKSPERIGEYCDCRYGRLGKTLFRLKRNLGYELEPLMPGACKETAIYFRAPLAVVLHEDFPSACRQGACAFGSAKLLSRWTALPLCLTSKRFKKLRELLRKHDAP